MIYLNATLGGGNGSASFQYLYHEENPIPARGRELLEPHSQYWLIAAEWGILGLAALTFFFAGLWIACWRLKTMRPLAMAIFLPFVLACYTDSLLLYSGTGYFFLMMMALCLGENEGN